MYEYPDSGIYDLVCENSEVAVEYLYERYNYLIEYIVKKYDSFDQDEIRQVALIGLYNAILNYSEENIASLKTYAVICMESKIKNYIKKKYAKKRCNEMDAISLDYEYENYSFINNIVDENINIEKKMINQEKLALVKKELFEVLSFNEARVFKLYIEGYSLKEISEVLNMNIKQVYNYMERAKNKAKKIKRRLTL